MLQHFLQRTGLIIVQIVNMAMANTEWLQWSYQIEHAESEFLSVHSHVFPMNNSENYGYTLFRFDSGSKVRVVRQHFKGLFSC